MKIINSKKKFFLYFLILNFLINKIRLGMKNINMPVGFVKKIKPAFIPENKL